jgi:hypothetical protein
VIVSLSSFLGTQTNQNITTKDTFFKLVEEWLKKATVQGKSIALCGLLATSFKYSQEHLDYIWKIY